MAYCTTAQVKTYLGTSSSDDDTLIGDLISRAEAIIDTFTQRTFEASSNTTHKFTVGIATVGRMLYLDDDLAAISTVKTDADNGSGGTTITSGEYVTHPMNRTPYYAIEILSSSDNDWTYTDDPQNGIEISGKWAYSETAPTDIIHACIRLTAFLYLQKDAQAFDGAGVFPAGALTVPGQIPQDIQQMLLPYQKLVDFGY